MSKRVKHRLGRTKVIFTYGALGQPAFIKDDAISLGDYIDPTYWSVSQLRAIVKYMDENPKCSLYTDGSGTPLNKRK